MAEAWATISDCEVEGMLNLAEQLETMNPDLLWSWSYQTKLNLPTSKLCVYEWKMNYYLFQPLYFWLSAVNQILSDTMEKIVNKKTSVYLQFW